MFARTPFIAAAVTVMCLVSGPRSGSAADIFAASDREVSGRDDLAAIDFSSQLNGQGEVTVILRLGDDKRIVAELDYDSKSVRITSSAKGSNRPISLQATEIARLNRLRQTLDIPGNRVGDALASLVGWLSEAPPRAVIDLAVGDRNSPVLQDVKPDLIRPSSIIPLCNVTAGTAIYTVGKKTIRTDVEVGSCYNQANECLGRCGAGCADNPANPTYVQRITQDCLNHDVCNRDLGTTLGQCSDEFAAAADDFLFGEDCGSLTGRWIATVVGEPAKLRFSQDTDTLRGKASVPQQCDVKYRLSGQRANRGVFSFKLRTRASRCCTSATVHAEMVDSCDTATGQITWSGNCEGSSAITLQREDAGAAPASAGLLSASRRSKPAD